MIDLVITSIRTEAGAPLEVTVAERHSPRSCVLRWEAHEVAAGFVAALQEESRLQTAILVGDRFFARSPRRQRAEFGGRLRQAIIRQMKPSPWGCYRL